MKNMRLTTKIVLGGIASIFLISILSIAYLATGYDEAKKQVNIRGKSVSTDVPACKVIVIDSNTDESMKLRYGLDGIFQISPSQNGEKGKIYFTAPLEPFTKYTLSGDTLRIFIDSKRLLAGLENPKNERASVNLDYILFLDSAVSVFSNVRGMDISLNNMKGETIKLSSLNGNINVNQCTFRTLSPIIREYKNFSLQNSTVDTLNIDLDFVNGWTVNYCNINVENLTGSGRWLSVSLPKSEVKEMNWYPKDKNTRLTVQLDSDTTRITFP